MVVGSRVVVSSETELISVMGTGLMELLSVGIVGGSMKATDEVVGLGEVEVVVIRVVVVVVVVVGSTVVVAGSRHL